VDILNKQVLLASWARGLPQASDFRFAEQVLSPCKQGHVIIKNHYLSVDPAQKGWMSKAQNYSNAALGEPMKALAVGEVIESSLPEYKAGDFVSGWFGWQQYAHVDADAIDRKINPATGPIQNAIGLLGIVGLTAYIALKDVINPRPGQTILVSTAAGGVGSIVGQLAKRWGCRVIGITGSDEKLGRCLNEFGYNAAFNYKKEGWQEALKAACPEGIDGYFDMAGGWISDGVVELLNARSVHVQVGTAAVASWDPTPQAPRRERLLLVKEITHQGFVIFNHASRFDEASRYLAQCLANKELVFREQVLDGLESAPQALESLYQGKNNGKILIRLT